MPTFRLGECSVELTIEPLTGPLAQADRQVAWQLYIDLVARPVLRADTATAAELGELLVAWRALLAPWPAAHLETPSADHLGAVMLTVIELLLLPCLRAAPPPAPAWASLRAFFRELAQELARRYRFHDAGAAPPADLSAIWQARP